MSLVVVSAGKGSPGVTTTALALSAVWPRPALLMECDPAGGDLPYFMPAADGGVLSPTRGVVSLAAATRSQQNSALRDHAQVIGGGMPVMVGPSSPAQVAALAPSWQSVIEAVRRHDEDVIVDRGRFTHDEVSQRLIGAAQLTVLVCRASVASVAHVRQVLTALGRRGDGSRPSETVVAVVVLGELGTVREVARALASHTPALVLTLADDPVAARGLCGQWSRRLDRSRLVVSARLVARQLDRLLTSSPAPVYPNSAREDAPVQVEVGQ